MATPYPGHQTGLSRLPCAGFKALADTCEGRSITTQLPQIACAIHVWNRKIGDLVLQEDRMDLGIAGRKAIVCASSRGLGRACAMQLAEAGCEVVVNGLDPKRLDVTAADI